MGREQSLPIFIGNDFEVAQDDICTKTWILLHYISWADTPVCPFYVVFQKLVNLL